MCHHYLFGTFDGATESIRGSFRHRLSRERCFQGVAQLAGINLSYVAAVVDAAVIQQFVIGVEKICLGCASGAECVGKFVAVVFENREGQLVSRRMIFYVRG